MSEAVQAIIDTPAIKPPAIDTQTNVGDASTDGTSSTPKQDDKVSQRLEILIKREQQAMARERIAKASEAESTRLRAELESERAKIAKFNSIKTNPKLALDELGLTYDEITKAMLADGQLPPEVEIKKLRGDLDGIKQAREDERKLQAQQAKAQAQAQEAKAVDDFKGEIKTYAIDNAARYELINFDERFDEVYELIDAHYTRTQLAHAKELEADGKNPNGAIGKVMNIAEAADKIEEYYEKRELEKKKLSKLQSLWGAVPKESLAKAVEEARKDKSPPTRTLTNNLSAANLKPKSTRPPEDKRVEEIVAKWRASRGG